MFDPNTESLKQNIALMEAYMAIMGEKLAAMKDTLSKRERNWPKVITKGMLFRHECGDVYMTVRTDRNESLILAHISSGDAGNSWSYGECFNGKGHEFTYIGLAADHLRIV